MLRTMQNDKSGFLTILFSQAKEPLAYWDKQIMSGRIKRVVDESDKKMRLEVLELLGNNVHSTYISTPTSTSQFSSLGVTLPVLVLIVKNLKRYFFYQVQILDEKNCRRRFRFTNISGFHRQFPTVSIIPITLQENWNELAVNLAELTEHVYGTRYVETVRVEIHANCQLRQVFFCENMDAMQTKVSRPNLKNIENKSIITSLTTKSNLFSFKEPQETNQNQNDSPINFDDPGEKNKRKIKTGTNNMEDAATKTVKEY